MKAMNHPNDNANSGGKYALGHSQEELDRLKEQARLIDPITQRFFHEAGVGPGMRVLDVGCGAGDTSLLVAEMVGERGEVVGADRATAAIAAAQAKGEGRRNLRFLEGDPADMSFEQPFDAVVGRYVLMFQEHPPTMLRRLASHLRPGGLLVFHELDYAGISSFPPLQTFEQIWRWNADTTRLYGADPRMGVLTTVFPHARHVSADVSRLESRCVERWIEKLDQCVLATNQARVHCVHCHARARIISRAGQHRPALRNRIDLTFGIVTGAEG